MIRNLIILLLSLLPLTGISQTGEWLKYSVFSGDISHIVDTPSKVYYVSSGYLFSYDKDNDETISYNSQNYLNDDNVDKIFYNKERKYLFISYTNGAIDLLYDNGKSVYYPDIKDASIGTDKYVTDVAFDGDNIYVATYFGLVILDEKKQHVKDSGIYNTTAHDYRRCKSVCIIENYIFINYDGCYYKINKDRSIKSINNFSEVQGLIIEDSYKIDVTTLVNFTEVGIFIIKYDNVSDADTRHEDLILEKYVNTSNHFMTDYGLYFTMDGNLYLVTKDRKVSLVKELPDVIKRSKINSASGLNSMWCADENGVSCYDISGENVTVKHDKIKPTYVSSVYRPGFIIPNRKGNRIYVSNKGAASVNPATEGEGTNLRQLTDVIEGNTIKNVKAREVSYITDQGKSVSPYVVSPQAIVEDPDDENIYYIGSSFEGIYVIKDGVEIGKYQGDQIAGAAANAPFGNTWGWRSFGLNIDTKGNLWTYTDKNGNYEYINVLPANKRKLKTSEVKKEDWHAYKFDNKFDGKDVTILNCKYSNMIFITCGGSPHPMAVIDTKGTYDNFNDDVTCTWSSFIDQDGKSFECGRYSALCEDDRGRIWIGTSMGIIEITRPSDAMNQNMRVNRLKVPRNDGTNLADYLLETETILAISVDNSNRKWIATLNSGVYLVSENGDKILEHFTTENSPLTTNTINTLYADRLSNAVYIATNDGLYRYNSDSSPAMDNYENVYAYPNPVRPEYTGWITITGLMDDSHVKIADASGNVIYQGRSEGGMLRWDGCNSSGARVKSGIYYVFASHSDGDSSTGKAATKIMVIN